MLRCLSQERKEAQKATSAPDKRIKEKRPPQTLSVDDMAQAEEAVVHFEQEQSFHEEMAALRKGSTVKKSNSVYRLDPVLRNGVLRIRGRLSRSALPEVV